MGVYVIPIGDSTIATNMNTLTHVLFLTRTFGVVVLNYTNCPVNDGLPRNPDGHGDPN